jgi:hypothetical protein
VLPLWCDRLQIVLTPEHVTVARLGAGIKPHVVFNKTMTCAAPIQDEAAWLPAIRVMRQLLLQAGPKKANAEIILSNHFVRYQLIKAQPDLGSLEEEQAFVRFSFTEVYGNESANWALRWGAGLDINAQVASAIDQVMLDHIANIFADAGIKLVSLQPYLMAAFNHLCKSFDHKPVWFVLVEAGRVCIAMLKDGDWKSLHTSKLGIDWADELPNVIEREFQRSGAEDITNPLVLCLPGFFDHKRLMAGSRSVRVLTMSPESLQKRAVVSISNVEVKS